jgi:hypothetical protein
MGLISLLLIAIANFIVEVVRTRGGRLVPDNWQTQFVDQLRYQDRRPLSWKKALVWGTTIGSELPTELAPIANHQFPAISGVFSPN